MQTTPSDQEPAHEKSRAERSADGLKKRLSSLVSVFFRPYVAIPLAFFIVMSLVFYFTNADIAISRCFYASQRPGDAPWERFPLMNAQPWILGFGGLAAWALGFAWKKIASWQTPGLFFFLLLAIGPGFLVNIAMKPCWARPRPQNTNLFGGQRDFVPLGTCGQYDDDFSFPSGHAAMGFYLMAPAFVCYRNHPRWALLFLLSGLAYGCLMSFARIAAGGHYASDVLWAGGIVYFTALLLAAIFRFNRPPRES
jgi:membrane-associated PAP2 superfamily phosphatase